MAGRVAYARSIASRRHEDAATAAIVFEQCGALLFAAERAPSKSRVRGGRLQRRAPKRACGPTNCSTPAKAPARHPLLDATVSLSSREREVALLATSGLSSQQIADRLFLSKRTVENHLQRAYTKLGVTSREALSSAMRQ